MPSVLYLPFATSRVTEHVQIVTRTELSRFGLAMSVHDRFKIDDAQLFVSSLMVHLAR